MAKQQKLSKNIHTCATCGNSYYRRGNRPTRWCSITCRNKREQPKAKTIPSGYFSTRIAGDLVGYSGKQVRQLARRQIITAIRLEPENERSPYYVRLDDLRDYAKGYTRDRAA